MDDAKHYRVCNLCEAMCGIEVTQSHDAGDERIEITIKPDTNDPFSKGSMCPKAPALAALHTDPSRLRYPVKRVEGEWVEITWDEAYSTIESNIKRIRSAHGADAIASYLGNPIVHNLGMLLFIKDLTQALGSKNVFSATSMDQLPHHFAAHFMFGHEFRIPVPDVDRTDFMLIMGANPIASNGSIMTSAGIRERIKHIKSRGGQVVVLDPRITETAKIATSHHFIRPGTDVFFLLAFLHVLFRDQHVVKNNLLEHTSGFEEIKAVAQHFNPEQAEPLTDVPAQVIEELVRNYMSQERAVLYGRMGLSTQRHGGLCHWLINSINILSGHFDTPGGMMFPTPAIELARGKSQQNRVGRWSSRVRQMPEFYGELPVSAMTEELTTTGEGQVRAFMTVCGNPVLSSPGGHRLDDALPDIEFMFSIDNYINETTRHADIILPTPSGLEVDHYDVIFNLISVTNNVKYSQPLFPPADDRPPDWQVLKELISRLSPTGPGLLHRFKTPRRIINWGLMLGAYGKLSHPKRWRSGLNLKKVIDSVHGISLGPLVSRVPEGLMTPDRKIHLAASVFIDHIDVLLAELEQENKKPSAGEADKEEFQLIGRRHVNTNNSWMHQVRKLSISKQVRCTVMINDKDAERLSIRNDDVVKVQSNTGVITLPAEVTDTMMPNVISIPHGFGHTRAGTRIPHAEAKPGVSVNDITDPSHVDALTGNAAFSGLTVFIERVGSSTSEVRLKGKPLTILYGSRTGNAEFTAEDIAKRASEHGLLARSIDMDKFDVAQLASVDRLLLVCSTYGEGDMPDNAQRLWDSLSGPDAPKLNNTHFSVLAFGDRSYETFCEAGKNWDAKLSELGATRIADRVDCDVDYLDASEQWIDSVLPIIGDFGDQTEIEASPDSLKSEAKRYSKANPFPAQLLQKYRLNSGDSTKETYHYSLSLSGSGLRYNAGDTINVVPNNREELVDELLTLVSGDSTEEIDRTVRDRLLKELEIRIPSRALLDELSAHSPHQDVRDLLGSGDQSKINTFVWGKDVVDLLRSNSGVITTLDDLLAVLRPIQPRSYSISSSINSHADEVHLTVANVRYSVGDRAHHGVASCYLADDVAVGDTVSVYLVPTSSFSLPDNDDTPIIMIGPGTGVAPFRGFLQEREFRQAKGKSWLFFGDRNEANDFLYETEFKQWLAQGHLDQLDLAFSRDQTEKIYVQHRMLENAEKLYNWLEQGAVVYVCGDASRMAKDVDHALLTIVEQQGALTAQQAHDYVATLSGNKRYLRDVY